LTDTLWYRVVDGRYAPPLDEWEYPVGQGRVYVSIHEYRVTRETPKGVWLDNGRFVLRDARKRWACPTRDEAVESFLARKRRQLRLLNSTVSQVEQAVTMVAGLLNG
jgi:hypothetical protein